MSDGAVAWAIRQRPESVEAAMLLVAIAKITTAAKPQVSIAALAGATGSSMKEVDVALGQLLSAYLISRDGTTVNLAGYLSVSRVLDNSGESTLGAWRQRIKEAGEAPIKAGDPIFDYANEVGLHPDMIPVQWHQFVQTYTEDRPTKKYSDWRAAFRNSIRGNWFKLWSMDAAGSKWTSNGLQAAASYRALMAQRRAHTQQLQQQ